MKYIYLFITAFVSIGVCQAQVGINTHNPLGIFHIDGKKDNQMIVTNLQLLNDFVISSEGYVGVGSVPSVRLQIYTGSPGSGLKLTDGTEGVGRTLLSDSQGIGTWNNKKQSALVWDANRRFTISHTGIYLITIYLDDNNTTNAYTNKWVNPTLDGGTGHNGVSLWSDTRNTYLISSSNDLTGYGVSCSGTLLLFAGEILALEGISWNSRSHTPILGVEIIAL